MYTQAMCIERKNFGGGGRYCPDVPKTYSKNINVVLVIIQEYDILSSTYIRSKVFNVPNVAIPADNR